MLSIHHYVRGPLENNVHLLVEESSGRAAIVDPGIDSDDLLEVCVREGWRIELILNTHAHFDHVYLNGWYAEQTGAPIALHPDDLPLLQNLAATCERWGIPAPPVESPAPSIQLEHGLLLDVLGQRVEVRHTPGHSPGQVAFIFEGQCLSGDTLFWRAIGRWDLPGADFHQLERSIREQLYTLPDATHVWPGHGDRTTIGDEKQYNPFVPGEGIQPRVRPKL